MIDHLPIYVFVNVLDMSFCHDIKDGNRKLATLLKHTFINKFYKGIYIILIFPTLRYLYINIHYLFNTNGIIVFHIIVLESDSCLLI